MQKLISKKKKNTTSFYVVVPSTLSSLGATAAHHGSLVLGDITTETLFFLFVKPPFVVERVQAHLHHAIQDLAVSFTLHTLNDFVEDPASWHELGRLVVQDRKEWA